MKKYFIFFAIAWVIFISHAIYTRHAIYGDGNGYYSYTQALFFDKSLNFSPIYNFLGHFQGRTGEFSRLFWDTGKNNPFPIGTGIVWLPSMALMSIFSDDRFSLIYELGPGLTGIVFMLAGLFLIEKYLSERFSKNVVFWTILTLFFGSNIFYYTAFEPALSHQPAFLIVAILIYLTSGKKKFSLVLIGLLSGLLVSIRNADVILLIPILYAIKERRTEWIQYALGFLVGIAPQIANQAVQYQGVLNNPYLTGMDGTWQVNPAHTLEFLISPKRGLFMWTPVFLLATYGLIKQKRVLILITLFIVVAVSSSWSAYLSAGFGQRFMFSAIPFFAPGIAYIYSKVNQTKVWKYFGFFSIYNALLLAGFYLLGWKNLP